MSLIKTQPKLLMGKANPAGERHCNKQRAKSLPRSVSIKERKVKNIYRVADLS